MNAKSKPETPTPYKRRLIGVDRLLKQRNVNAYRVAVELAGVYGDAAFITEVGGEDQAIAALDKYAGRLFLLPDPDRHPFHDLQFMLQRWPDEADWKGGDLAGMFAAMIEEAARHEDPSPQRPRRTVKLKEFMAVKEKLQQTERQADETRRQVESLEARCFRLEEENRQLRSENAELRRQLAETREPVAA